LENLREQNKNVIAFYLVFDRPTVDLTISTTLANATGLSPSSPIADRIKVLKGKKYGISQPGVPGDIFLRAMLKDNGIDPEREVEFIRIGTVPGLFAAMKSGQIDGFMLSAPSPQQAEETGIGKIWISLTAGDVPSLAKLPYMTFCALADYVKAHRQAVIGYVAAIQEANNWMRSNKAETATILASVFPSIETGIWAKGFDASLPAFSKDGRMNETDMAAGYRFLEDIGVTSAVPDSKEGVTWTNEFLTK
jgi:NitT/TauT family transport system substrate-binding protein